MSTASALYLKNQADLQYRYELLYPFLGAAFCVFGIGIAIALVAKKVKSFSAVLWAYYLLAPAYMIFQSGAEPLTEPTSLTIWGVVFVVIFLGLTVLLDKKLSIPQVVPLFAMISCAFIALDSYNFFSGYQSGKSLYPVMTDKNLQESSDEKRPNIYHLVLDEYQTDMFTLTLSPEVKEKLSGFTLFDNATALFGRTEMSLPSVFSGRRYNFDSPPVEYQKAAFSGENSLLSILKKYGYQTYAVMFRVFDFDLEQFDSIAFHQPVWEFDSSTADVNFRKLWAYSVLPSAIIGQFLDPIDLDQLKHKNLLPVSAPIESYESMLGIIAQEKQLPASGRYQFIHLLVPHFPYVLKSDCSYTQGVKSSPLAQSHCATKLITDFIETLKALGRFDDSIIIIQSDHGARFKIVDGKLRGLGESDKVRFSTAWSRARSRSLLMIKPAGVTATEAAFYTSGAKVSLLDIAPTIVQSLGLSSGQTFDGSNIVDPAFIESDQPRYYYFYNKKGARGKHLIKMTRFRIEDSRLIDEGLVKTGVFN